MADSSGGFFGGLSTGLGEADDRQLAQRKQQQAEQQAEQDAAGQRMKAGIAELTKIADSAASGGKDPKTLLQNPAVQAVINGIIIPNAKHAGIDPQSAAGMAQSVFLRAPQEPDSAKPVSVKPGDTLVHPKTGAVVYSAPPLDPLTGKPMDVAGGAAAPPQVAAAPPVPAAPPGPVSAAPQALNSPDVPVTPASFNQRFTGGSPEQPPAPAVPTGPTLPPNMQPGSATVDYAIKNNIHGDEFLKALPPTAVNTVRGIIDYKVDPDKLSKRVDKSGQSEYTRFLGFAHQATNGEYDPKYYKSMQKSISEFTTGGSTSPAFRIETANKAIAHGGEVADAIDKLAAVPGLLDRIAKSNTPIVSYAANQLKNKAVVGTSEGEALAAFKNASNHFSDEVTKFYAGGQPAEAGRERVLSSYDAAKSPQEIYSALMSETRLMHGASAALQDRFKNAQAGPRYNNELLRQSIQDFPVISQRAETGLARISEGYERMKGGNKSNPGAGAPSDPLGLR